MSYPRDSLVLEEVPMHAPSRRTRLILLRSSGPVAFLLAGMMIWQGSQAAFTAEAYSAGNNWSAGAVTLTSDNNGAAAFSVKNVKPGDTGTKCIVVTSGATLPGLLKTYVSNLETAQSKGLEKYIKIQISEGTGGSFNDCTGYAETAAALPPMSLADAALYEHDYASGGHPWSTTGTPGEHKSYKATWVFDATGLTQTQIDALQGGSVRVDFEWELQNT
jgi:hypothetical protein